MERIVVLLGALAGCFVAAQSTGHTEESPFSWDFFFEGVPPFPFEKNFKPVPHDATFSSWPTVISDFRALEDWPPIGSFPKVEVSCDDSRLTVLVWKDYGGVPLTAEEVQLGDGCYRTAELPNQLVFIYNLDECGTSHVMQNDLESFTNTLYIHDFARAWWKSPSTVDISCTTSRPDKDPDLIGQLAPPEHETRPRFSMRAVNSLWTGGAESTVYTRGQMINLQVSAHTRPEEQQQLFTRSCFVSAFPEPHTRPRHAVVMNKGCAAWSSSTQGAAQFLASHQADVNFALNTSKLIPEVYVHCSVVLSDQGVTVGSKSCNYDATEAKWKELSGASEMCDCCSAKCKDLSKISEEFKAIVSAGPFSIIDEDVKKQSSSSDSEDANSMQSDGPNSVDHKVSGESPPREEFHPRSVVAAHQEPEAKPEETSSVFQAEHRPSTTEEEPLQETPTDMMSEDGMKVVALAVVPHMEAEDAREGIKSWLARFGLVGVKARREAVAPPDETIDAADQEGPSLKYEPLTSDVDHDGAVIRSKVQFTKTADGTKTLSYEEERVKPGGDCAEARCGMRRHQEQGRRRSRLRSTFLNFLRRLDGAE